MDKKDLEFQKRIQETFRIEAEEHIRAISAGLSELEKSASKKKTEEMIEALFREVHSLKGAARSVDQKEIETVCQPMENIFSSLKRKEIIVSPVIFDILFKTIEWLSKFTVTPGAEKNGTFRQTLQELISRLREVADKILIVPVKKKSTPIIPEQTRSSQPVPVPEPGLVAQVSPADLPPQTGMVRIPIAKLDPLLLQAEELLQSKIAVDQRIGELHSLCNEVNEWRTETQKWRTRRATATAAVWNEWCDTSEMQMNKVESKITEITRSIEHDQHGLDLLVSNHLDAMKQVLMLPVGSLVEAFPRMIREIAREQNKEIEFIVIGTELEIDKRILEELKDPLIHMIRNSINHGLGTPQERLLENKPQRGKITLAFVAKESGLVEITLSDDGKGINKDLVLKAAIKSGILSKEDSEKLETKEVLSFIYKSGISTSPIITDISGHGLGLSIVEEKVNKLNGKISVETVPKVGTTFKILLPMTLATFRGILVKVKEFMYFLPAMNVERVVKVKREEIKSVENHETVRIEDKIISVVDLGKVLGLPEYKHAGNVDTEPGMQESGQIRLVVLVSGEYRIAFKVDEVDDEQQVLVKGLGRLLNRVRNVSGATILGTGKVVPVLNIYDLMKSALMIKGSKDDKTSDKLISAKIRNILVAEDSITSRTLLKNILETAGYKVITAVDGADAFTKARTGNFDMIVSDVDMPKMNGFELTTKIRNDKKLSELPVVLVTALESREDREHGIEVGADAYVIKSSFDQTNLLEIIKKLI
jgi:two-component system chemotaxis sensor kinase CheA